jgi:hypothetical protein
LPFGDGLACVDVALHDAAVVIEQLELVNGARDLVPKASAAPAYPEPIEFHFAWAEGAAPLRFF